MARAPPHRKRVAVQGFTAGRERRARAATAGTSKCSRIRQRLLQRLVPARRGLWRQPLEDATPRRRWRRRWRGVANAARSELARLAVVGNAARSQPKCLLDDVACADGDGQLVAVQSARGRAWRAPAGATDAAQHATGLQLASQRLVAARHSGSRRVCVGGYRLVYGGRSELQLALRPCNMHFFNYEISIVVGAWPPCMAAAATRRSRCSRSLECMRSGFIAPNSHKELLVADVE